MAHFEMADTGDFATSNHDEGRHTESMDVNTEQTAVHLVHRKGSRRNGDG